jgi:Mor family transcriptional regulator
MHTNDIEIYQRWMAGTSIGALAKQYKLTKDQVRNIVNKTAKGKSWNEKLTPTAQ